MITPTKFEPRLERLNSGGDAVRAEPDAVVNKQELDVLAQLYSHCLAGMSYSCFLYSSSVQQGWVRVLDHEYEYFVA